MPKSSEHVHGEDGFYNRGNEGYNADGLEDIGKEGVGCGMDTVEDHGEMGKKFSDDIKCTPHATNQECYARYMVLLNAYCNYNLGYHDTCDVMNN